VSLRGRRASASATGPRARGPSSCASRAWICLSGARARLPARTRAAARAGLRGRAGGATTPRSRCASAGRSTSTTGSCSRLAR
jgi:hypothetical protein